MCEHQGRLLVDQEGEMALPDGADGALSLPAPKTLNSLDALLAERLRDVAQNRAQLSLLLNDVVRVFDRANIGRVFKSVERHLDPSDAAQVRATLIELFPEDTSELVPKKLDKKTLRNTPKLSYEELVSVVRSMGIKSSTQYQKARKAGHPEWPSSPNTFKSYKGKWNGWSDFLGKK